jgi:hypothetical protein
VQELPGDEIKLGLAARVALEANGSDVLHALGFDRRDAHGDSGAIAGNNARHG